ncbi:carboxypeptidase M32 [Brevirhabdus pacifica]|uniref:Metal-dependent carboxypeptidase n=1 Tax=Brevirhabdus pacifica TaxID=1267768 RepID=A0A1U7DLJ5_9RHOB|nr:carboxypeptidase M32 [Brevirhabdus pacifica]OWU80331.1 peptidase M32 [Loktanella sp. 22II-4b]
MVNLRDHDRVTGALAQVAGRLGWDQETVMPRGAAAQRGDEMAAMEAVLHARRSDPRLGEWLAAADTQAAEAQDKGLLRQIALYHDRACRVPGELASELARVTSLAQGVWAEARAAEDVAAFLPTLSRVVELRREEADALSAGRDLAPYDALLNDYEPGATQETLGAMFDALRPGLVQLREAIAGSGIETPTLPEHRFEPEVQLALASEIAGVFGYDLSRGRLDRAVHPFSSGSGADVRITTRTDATDPFNCLYSTIHEVGHACYEQTVAPEFALSALGQGASMGVHESQSRIYENQLGRSRAFTGWLYGRMRDTFGDFGVADPETFYRIVNRVAPGHIRTEADEVHYNLHVMLRFDLERRLIDGSLAVGDLEETWNSRFASDFGIAVDRPSHGLLQDVHWSVGLFGYFPTYTLGNVYAGCLNAAMRRDLPDLDAALARGETGEATTWLGRNLQQYGALHQPRALIELATGKPPEVAPLLEYLRAKFGDLYGLKLD